MNKILISPYSRKLRNNKRNPKDFPYWKELVTLLKNAGFYIIQVGVANEEKIEGVDECLFNKSLNELKGIVNECVTWISVDNFFQHLCWLNNKPGIVIFGQSDPEIFGHKENINLLKSREYLRKDQFNIWESSEYRENVFIDTQVILSSVVRIKENIEGDIHA
jgi:ADP-heptose:LPS heptosyltransferase